MKRAPVVVATLSALSLVVACSSTPDAAPPTASIEVPPPTSSGGDSAARDPGDSGAVADAESEETRAPSDAGVGVCGAVEAAPGRLVLHGTQGGSPVDIDVEIGTATPRYGRTVIGLDPSLAVWGTRSGGGIAVEGWTGSGTYAGSPPDVQVRAVYPIGATSSADVRNLAAGALAGTCSVCMDFDKKRGTISGTLTCADLFAVPPITAVTGSFRTRTSTEGTCGRVLPGGDAFELRGVDTGIALASGVTCSVAGGELVVAFTPPAGPPPASPLLRVGAVQGGGTFQNGALHLAAVLVPDGAVTVDASACDVCWDATDKTGRFFCPGAKKTAGGVARMLDVLGTFDCR
ncbi:MAG: hypothetical protein KC657_11120 [Myxococcales bacterium]|nr:hypothetical protein [Myxococcales bacterium]